MPSVTKDSKINDFSDTAAAAKLSGAFHQSAGLLKRKFAELTDDASLKDAGHEQQLRGKVHTLVGNIRGVREAAVEKFTHSRHEGTALFQKHGGRLIDLASDLVADLKKSILKS